ncbi:EAL domain-containing protein [Cupriavidus basilensis]
MGNWILDEACRQMREWRDAGHPHWTVAVNLSALQFRHASPIKTVRDTLTRHALEPGCLTLEVTESTAMRDADASLQILKQLHDMGVRISIDDFGTGYSSLALPSSGCRPASWKIDRGFIRDLARDTGGCGDRLGHRGAWPHAEPEHRRGRGGDSQAAGLP